MARPADPPDDPASAVVNAFLVQLVTTSLVGTAFLALSVGLRHDCAIEYLQTCPAPPPAPARARLRPPTATAAEPPPPPGACPLGLRRNWIGQCAPPFGVDEALVDPGRDLCDGVYERACAGWTAAGPRAFRQLDRFNRDRVAQVRQTQALQPDTWSRVASACDAARAGDSPGAAAEEARLAGAYELLARRGAGALIGILADAGVNGPFEVAPRLTPWAPREPALMVSLQADAVDLAAPPPPALDPDWTLSDAHRASAVRLLLELRALQTAVSMQAPPLRTLLSYLSSDDGARRDLRLSAGNATWLAAARDAMPPAVRGMRLWAREFDLVEGAVALLDADLPRTMHLLECLLWLHFNTLHGGARPSPTLGEREHRAAATPASLGLHPECERLASARVWWRTDAAFARHVLSPEAARAVAAVFERVRAAAAGLVEASAALAEHPELRAALAGKLRRARLRLDAPDAPRSNASASAPASLAAELRRAARLRWAHTTPRREGGRWVEALDSASASSNALYNPFDNTVTVLPGLLAGAFVPRFAAAARAEELLPTLGFVLAHELGHALDTVGAWFDAEGAWSDAHRDGLHRHFGNMRCLVRAFDDAGVDGMRTLNENFADHFAHRVIAALLPPGADREAAVLAHAQLWCGAGAADDADDPHSPAPQRVNLGWRLQGDWLRRSFGCAPADACAAL
jgi:hypothetical protein